MPIYEYKCELCDLTTTIISSIEDYESEVSCRDNDCSGIMKRVFTNPPGIIFEGGGWGCKN